MSQLFKRLYAKGAVFTNALMGVALYVLLFIIVVLAVSPERYGIDIGSPAPITIMATKDVVDAVTTNQLKETAARGVDPSYKKAEEDVASGVLADFDATVFTINSLLDNFAGDEPSDDYFLHFKESIAPVGIEKTQLTAFVSATRDTVDALLEKTRTLVKDALASYVSEGQEQEAVASVSRELAKSYDTSLVAVATNIVRVYLRPNMVIDEAVTETNRQAARDAVETVTRVKGEVIVREGEIVTLSQYEMLKSLGMVESEVIDMPLYYGVALFLALVMISTVALIYAFDKKALYDTKELLLLSIICIVTLVLCLLLRGLSPYFMPVTLGLILVTVLVNKRMALIINIFISIGAALIASGSSGLFTAAMFAIMITPIIASAFAFIFLMKRQARLTIMLTGLVVGAVMMVITLAIGFVNNTDVNIIITNGIWSAGSGVASAMLTIGIQPLLEWTFNLVTSTKLLELSNPSHPLLRRLMLEAPGTYHHSMIVANLAEAAATAIGANSLLARVGAYYHDVGKLKRPQYFKENQLGDNPHDRTDPRVSASIVLSHTKDGVQIAQKARLPEPLIEIIRSHHGDTAVVYFYDKAVKLYGDSVNAADFRYGDPRPKSREAAIVMLADAVEAAARSLPNPDPERMHALLRSIIRGKMEDGQLDDCELTFADLDKIREAFQTVLAGVFHERIEYPTIEVPQIDRDANQNDKEGD